jgi:hypothetical protein
MSRKDPDMSEHARLQRVRIIREVEAAAAADTSGRLPWRAGWAAYFGDRAGLVEALATRRQCLAIIGVESLPDPETRAMVGRRVKRTTDGLDRVIRRYGGPDPFELTA